MDQIGLLSKDNSSTHQNVIERFWAECDIFSGFCQITEIFQMMIAQVMVVPSAKDRELLHDCAKLFGARFVYDGEKKTFMVDIQKYCIGVN